MAEALAAGAVGGGEGGKQGHSGGNRADNGLGCGHGKLWSGADGQGDVREVFDRRAGLVGDRDDGGAVAAGTLGRANQILGRAGLRNDKGEGMGESRRRARPKRSRAAGWSLAGQVRA